MEIIELLKNDRLTIGYISIGLCALGICVVGVLALVAGANNMDGEQDSEETLRNITAKLKPIWPWWKRTEE